jgi:hypothetical protein
MILNKFYLHQLETYDILAWDIDETLIDNPYATAYAKYIIMHPKQTHIVVTHRSHGIQHSIRPDFEYFHGRKGNALYAMFNNIHAVPDEIYSKHIKAIENRLLGLPYDQAQIDTYHHWKGVICKEVGAQALIDDNIDQCYPGCEMHGIDFYYSYGLKR